MQMTVDFVPETMEAVSGIAFLKSYQKKKSNPEFCMFCMQHTIALMNERKTKAFSSKRKVRKFIASKFILKTIAKGNFLDRGKWCQKEYIRTSEMKE